MSRALVLVPALALTHLLLAGCADDKSSWLQPEAGGSSGPASEASPWPTGDLYLHTDAKRDGHVCGEAEFKIARTVTDMLILLDRSNSMAAGTPSLWDTCRNTIYDVTAAMDSNLWFGLFTFPGSVGLAACNPFIMFTMCNAQVDPTVGLAAGTSAAIKNALVPMVPCGGTPTALTLNAARTYLGKLAANQHPKYVLLVTDGGPTCNDALDPATCDCVSPGQCESNSQNCIDEAATLKALDDLCTAGIKTYVIGLGAAAKLTSMLQAMAQHGCTQKPYAPTDPAAIKKAFEDISGTVATCSYELDCAKIPNPGLVNFYFDGKAVPRTASHTAGWDWSTACKDQTGKGLVEFYGADCAAIKDGGVKTIAAKFGCKTIE